MTSPTTYRKAIAAAVLALTAWYTAALPEGISGAECWGLGAVPLAFLGTYFVTNEPADPEAGRSGTGALVWLLVGVVLGVLLCKAGVV